MTPEEEIIAAMSKPKPLDKAPSEPHGRIVKHLTSENIAACRADGNCMDINEGDNEGYFTDPDEYEKNIRDQPGENEGGEGQQTDYKDLFKKGTLSDEEYAAQRDADFERQQADLGSNAAQPSAPTPGENRATMIMSNTPPDPRFDFSNPNRKGRLFGTPLRSTTYKPPRNGPF